MLQTKHRNTTRNINKNNRLYTDTSSIHSASATQDFSNNFKVLYLNCQSSRKRTTEIHDLINELNADDLVLLTDTWFKQNEDEHLIKSKNFNIISIPRHKRPEGEFAILYRKSLKVRAVQTTSSPPTSFEHCTIKV